VCVFLHAAGLYSAVIGRHVPLLLTLDLTRTVEQNFPVTSYTMLRVLALLAAARAASAGAAGGHLSLAPALPQQPEDERRVSALERRLHELEDENARLRASQDAADSLAAKSLANTDTWDAVPAEWADHIANARAHVAKHLDAPKPHGHSISDQRFWDALRPVFDEKNFPGGAKLKLQVHRKLQADRRRLQGGTFKHAANACPFGGHWNLAESFDPFGCTYRPTTLPHRRRQ
jgi:hypothetical protein